MVIANCVQCTSTTADALSKQEGQADRGSLLCLAEKEVTERRPENIQSRQADSIDSARERKE